MEKLILESVVRSTLIAGGAAAALYALGVKAARVRHTVWASVVALMLILPLWTVWGPKAVLRVLTPPAIVVDAAPVVIRQAMVAQPAPAPQVPDTSWAANWTWESSLFVCYLLGFAGLMARLITGTVRARRLVRRAGNRAGRLTSDACVTPITVGWLRPAVILPSNWTRWSRAQLNAVLAHEDEHARRRDPLVQWLALLNRAVFWFHPLAWWLERNLSGLAEQACDDAVLTSGHDPLQYSEYLLGLARVVSQSGARVSAVGMAMPGTYLPERILRLATGAPLQRVSRLRMISVGMVCAMVSMLFTAGAIGYAAPRMVRATTVAVLPDVPAPDVPAPVERVRPVAETHTPKKTATPVLMAQTAPEQGLNNTTAAVGQSRAAAGQSVFGVVTDPSGAVVARASVTLTSTSTGGSITQTTGPAGQFRFDNIAIDNYNVTVKTPGFKVSTQTGIRVSAGDAHNLGTVPLRLGDVNESVSVTGSRSAPLAQPLPVTPSALGPMTTLPPMTTVPPPGTPPAANFTPRASTCAPNCPQRVGGMVQAANLINAVRPVYPPELLQQGIQGTVRMEAVISKEGRLSDLKVIGSPDPGLAKAAMDAVWKWLYKPTLLNNEPVEVLTTIDVTFSLAN